MVDLILNDLDLLGGRAVADRELLFVLQFVAALRDLAVEDLKLDAAMIGLGRGEIVGHPQSVERELLLLVGRFEIRLLGFRKLFLDEGLFLDRSLLRRFALEDRRFQLDLFRAASVIFPSARSRLALATSSSIAESLMDCSMSMSWSEI
jgi:hypothetical protein